MTSTTTVVLESTLASAGGTITKFGTGGAIASFVLSAQFGVLIGVLVAIGGYIMNHYYRRKEDKRNEARMLLEIEEHNLRMEVLRKGSEVTMIERLSQPSK